MMIPSLPDKKMRTVDEKIKRKIDLRAKQLREFYSGKLQELVNKYFNNWSDDKEVREIARKELRKEWGTMCYNGNRVQKLIPLNIEMFDVALQDVISRNKQFQEVIDITNL